MTEHGALWQLLLGQADLDLRAVARCLASSFSADGCLVLVVDDTGKDLVVAAAIPPGGANEQALRIPLGYGVAGLVGVNGRAVRLDADSPRNESHRDLMSLASGQTVSRMCLPARGGGEIVAVVSIYRRGSVPFAEADLDAAQRLLDVLGLRLYAQQLQTADPGHRNQRDRLIAQAISAQETERRRIAGDLHDGVTQALVSLNFHLAAAVVSLASNDASFSSTTEEASVQIQSARRLARLAYDETRAAISGLHSPILDDLGLVAALESLTGMVPQLDIEFRATPDERLDEVPDHCAATLYRIAQEAINNVVKHADARRAVLSIRRVSDLIVLAVTDDGAGFDVASVRASRPSALADYYGLSSIAERCALIGASLRIDSVEGRGTAVIVKLPLPTD